MLRRCLVAAALAALSPFSAADVLGELGRLGSPHASERIAAERWLAANLEAEDLPLVAQTALAGLAEVRARLTNAIGSDDRHFDLAALLASEREPQLRRLGASALGVMAARWFGSVELPALDEDKLAARLEDLIAERTALRATTGELAADLERLARLSPRIEGGSGRIETLGLALDPLLAVELDDPRRNKAESAPSERWIEGTFDQQILDLCEFHAVRAEGFGFSGPHPWVRVAHRADATGRDGFEHALRWCRDVLEYGDRPRGRAAARALAGMRWPAATQWLERRWKRTGDEAALHGVLLAASRGDFALALADGEEVRALLSRADAALASDRAEVRRAALEVLHALERAPSIGAGPAGDLAEAACEGFDAASPAGKRLRAAILAGMGRAPETWRTARRSDLTRAPSSLDTATCLAYLRALARTRPIAAADSAPPAWPIAEPTGGFAALLELAERDRLTDSLAAWAASIGARPPPAWRDPSSIPSSASPPARGAAIEWWLACDVEVAARHVRAWAESSSSPSLLGDRLGAWVDRGEAAAVEKALELARQGASAPVAAVLDRAAGFAGVLAPERAEALEAALLERRPLADADLAVLGALVGRRGVRASTAALIGELTPRIESKVGRPATPADAWVDAASRALRGLRAGRADGEAAHLVRALKSSLRRSEHQALSDLLREERWPPPPGAPPLSLECAAWGP